MKIVLRFPRALNSGWLPTNPPEINEQFNCKSDLGTFGIHHGIDFPTSSFSLQHGQSYSVSVKPIIVQSDPKIKNISPSM